MSAPSGTYGFTALIGSVLNGAIQLGSPVSTKSSAVLDQQAIRITAGHCDNGLSLCIEPVHGSRIRAYLDRRINGSNGGGVQFTAFTVGHRRITYCR